MKELKPMIHDEKNGLDYILVGDYYIPLIRVAEETRDIGFYGSLRRNYLKDYRQLKAIYKDNADTIIGNMDTSIFLGGKEPTTLKELAAVLGKETIDTYNTGENRGRETSHSLNYQKLGKDMPYLFVKSSVALNLS